VAEATVTAFLHGVVAQTPARLLSGVTLPTASGGTTQMDHILLTTSRIFVIAVTHGVGTIPADPLQHHARHVCVVREQLSRCLWASPNLLEYLVVGLVVWTGSAPPGGRWPRGMGDLAWLAHTLARAQGTTLFDAATLERCATSLEAAALRHQRVSRGCALRGSVICRGKHGTRQR
jgi:Nuclease-related domain